MFINRKPRVLNWYGCPQVHTSRLIDDAECASLRQGEGLVSAAMPTPSPHPPSPGLSFSSSLPFNQLLPAFLFPKDHETKSDKPERKTPALLLASSVVLDKLLNLSEPQFLHLQT